jgi:uncharacterized protein YbaR (Trm112 family)
MEIEISELVEILRCAKLDGGTLKLVEDALVCQNCGKSYPIQNGILNLLREEK